LVITAFCLNNRALNVKQIKHSVGLNEDREVGASVYTVSTTPPHAPVKKPWEESGLNELPMKSILIPEEH
jgi:hypothetical protein